MKRNVRLLITLVVFLLVALLVFHECRNRENVQLRNERTDSGKAETVSGNLRNKDGMAAFLKAFEQRIDLYGKVQDQHGKPIEGATVEIHASDKPFSDGSPPAAILRSDASGAFSILGLKGVQLGVSVNKKGYIYYSPLGGPTSSAVVTDSKYADPLNPLILTLHDPGVMEPLIHIEEQRWKLPADGTLRKIFLDAPDGKQGGHAVEVRYKSEYNQLPEEKLYGYRFNWGFELRVSNGGFVRNENDLRMGSYYQFEAPVEGYKEVVRYQFFNSQSENEWRKLAQDSLFVKFPDGSYGRIRFKIEGDAYKSPLILEAWYNSKLGSCNLSSLYK